MEITWLGRYRSLVAALVRHGNSLYRAMPARIPMLDGIALNLQEWQILEYLLEHEEDNACMNRISEQLGIPQSSLSKAVKNLCSFGLTERYRRGGNRKDVILRATPLGRSLYLDYAPKLLEGGLDALFGALESLDDAALAAITEAVEKLTLQLSQEPEAAPLIPMEESGE